MKRERLLEVLSSVDKDINDEYSDRDLIECVRCLKTVNSELEDESRWWSTWADVYEVQDGVYLKYYYARATGDNTPSELGYEDNGLDDIFEVKREVISTYTYVNI